VPEGLRAARQSLGFIPRRKGKSVLVWGRSSPAFARLHPLLEAIKALYPRLNIYRIASSAQVSAELTARYGETEVLAPPAQFAPARWLYGLRAKPKILLYAEPPVGNGVGLQRFAEAHGIALVSAVAAPPDGDDCKTWIARAQLTIALDDQAEAWLQRLVRQPGTGLRWRTGDEASMAALSAALHPLIVREGLGGEGEKAAADRLRRRLLALFAPLIRRKYHRLNSLQSLAEAIDHPATIMCLGNGPSSEDPRLQNMPYDALFRVNHTWIGRHILTDARLVFTGLRGTVAAVPEPCVFVFQTATTEQSLLLKCLNLSRHIRYATAEGLGTVDFNRFGSFVPTNGAVMLATAVALRPRRLIVGGMDLFQHPQGSYPGDSSTPNAYTILHDRDMELGFILETLAQHDGELEIVGDVLARHWQAYRAEGHAQSLDSSG
jgi:hypothetical protein